MQFTSKTFELLEVDELFDIYRLRSKVFVVEQNCAYQDVDEKDKVAYHILLNLKNNLVAYARILPPGVSYKEASIGRVVVDKDHRKKKVGIELMKYCLKKTQELYKNQDIVISAQTYLTKFYVGLGFSTENKEYLEDDIPHIQMRYKVTRVL